MGYSCHNPKELKDAILRRLGAPIIQIEVTQDHVFDCIQRAIELYGDYHYDGVNKTYMAVSLTAEQAEQGLIKMQNSENVFAVTKIVRTSNGCLGEFGGATFSWFTDFVNGLAGSRGMVNQYGPMSGIGGMGYYTQLMGYMNQMRDILQPLPEYWFNSTTGDLRIFGNFTEGQVIILEAYVKSYVNLDQSNARVGSYGFTAGSSACGSPPTALEIYEDPFRRMTSQFKVGHSGDYLEQNVYNVRWVKDYATSLVKEVWGSILAKHQGMQLPGGVTVDGLRLIQEAREEIETLRDELYGLEEPLPILMG